MDGTEPITGTWAQHNGNIYKTKVADAFEQLFVDDQMMIEARWPNVRFEQIFDRSAWAKAGQGSRYGRMVDPALAETGVDWTGARVTLNVAHQFFTWNRVVDEHAKSSDTFTYAKNLDWITFYADMTTPWEDDYYYLSGKLEALDSPTEWFLDEGNGQLYLWAGDGRNPSGRKVVYKKRDYAFDISGCDYIEVQGFNFFATAFRFNRCNHCVVEKCRLMFPSYRRECYEGVQTKSGFEGEQRCAAVVGGHNTVRNTSIAYASGTGLYVKGESNVVEDCVIHDVSWNGSLRECALLVFGQGAGSGGSVVRQSTFYNAGNSMLVCITGSHTIEYNHIYSGGLLSKDVALLQTWDPSIAGSVVRYNWVHGCHTEGVARLMSCGGMGIRGDGQTRGLTVHHNVVWDCGRCGISIKGDHNGVFNNTIFDIGPRDAAAQKRQQGQDLLIFTGAEKKLPWQEQFALLKVQNANSLFYNNAVGNVVWRGKPLAVGDKFANNLELGAEPPEAWLADAEKMDFRPRKNSPLIDAGRVIPGFTDNYNGKAPDVGAYEYGANQWKAGGPEEVPLKIK
ncbi:MAG TPA: right-handed parallel beta-helix repeat-containing protein [Sedimentisphaerales bacterium]|nr:right-handed parallel beta-helix repeat-containing protein [Sedimentisphaerales bacterium]